MAKRKPLSSNVPAVLNWIAENKASDVAAMVTAINLALDNRAVFERELKPNGSHIELRKVIAAFRYNNLAAAFFVMVKANPELIFNRTRKAGTRADLKGLLKLSNFVEYVAGKSYKLDSVTKALFAATIIAAFKGVRWIASPEQELILSSEPVNSLPLELQTAIAEFKHKHMTLTGDSRPQSCRFRTTFANLGFYTFARDEFDNSDYSLGIMVNLESPVIQYLASHWGLLQFKGNDNV